MANFELIIPRPTGASGVAFERLVFIDNGDGTFTFTVKTSVEGNYLSNPAAITAGSGIVVAASGSATPGGIPTQVQFNNTGVLGGISSTSSDGANLIVSIQGLVAERPLFKTSIDDVNGNKIIGLNPTAIAVNFPDVTNDAAGAPAVVKIRGNGISGNVSLELGSKGALAKTQVKPGTDSATAFQVQTAAGVAILDVDTSSSRVGINNAAPGFSLDVSGTFNLTGLSTFGALETITISDAGTNSVVNELALIHNSGGAIAAGFGAGIRFGLQDSTTANQDAGELTVSWVDAIHATRSSQVTLQAVDQGAALADVARFAFAHNGGSPVAQIILAGTQAQANVPQIAASVDLQTGIRFASGNIFLVIGGNDKVQWTGAGMFADAVLMNQAVGDFRIRRTGANAGAIDNGAGGAAALAVTGVINAASVTGTPAGGSAAARLLLGTTAGFGIYYGSGAPTVVAAQGSLYLRSEGSTAITRAYIATDSAGTWTAITTVL